MADLCSVGLEREPGFCPASSSELDVWVNSAVWIPTPNIVGAHLGAPFPEAESRILDQDLDDSPERSRTFPGKRQHGRSVLVMAPRRDSIPVNRFQQPVHRRINGFFIPVRDLGVFADGFSQCRQVLFIESFLHGIERIDPAHGTSD